MMTRHIDRTFWGVKNAELRTENEDIKALMGIPRNKHARTIEEAKDMQAEEMYELKGGVGVHANARQAFQAIKGSGGKGTFADFEKTDEEAPEDINVYTDGSYVSNRRAYFSLAGSGVVAPKKIVRNRLV